MNHNFMTEDEGLLDSEPQYTRSSLYEKYFKATPYFGFDGRDLSLDQEKFKAWLKKNSYKLWHGKDIYFKEGSEKNQRYYINEKTNTMLITSKTIHDPTQPYHVTSSDDVHDLNDIQSNPDRFTWISFYSDSQKRVDQFKSFIKSIQTSTSPQSKLFMLKTTDYGTLELDSFPTTTQGTDLELNYGEKFGPIHEKILDHLNNQKSGLYIFHGPAGTGKTTYLKHLTTLFDKRKFIFVPNAMISEIFSPKMVDKLYAFKNSVLILEDAESCVFKRDGHNNDLVSSILNITDGLLKELLNISVIVTFNSAKTNELDDALLRPGRLKVIYKFDLLSLDEAKKLAHHLKKEKIPNKSMSLADIYNIEEDTGLEKEKEKESSNPLGFFTGQK